jgi:hypothetical protein
MRAFLLQIPCRCSKSRGLDRAIGFAGPVAYRIVGMTYSAPARMPVGQRAVTVLRRV